MLGPLSRAVSVVCEETIKQMAPTDSRSAVAAVMDGLGAPLRVAVAGPIKAGKSTLVNALLGERRSRTGHGECTMVVTWFRRGDSEHGLIKLVDGSERPLRLEADGMVPESLGVEPEAIQSVTLWLQTARELDTITLIDTPGLRSPTAERSERAERVLFGDAAWAAAHRNSGEAVSQADAMIFLLDRSAKQGDVAALKDFSSLTGGTRAVATNAVAVLSRADQIGDLDGDDPYQAANRIAARLARQEELRTRVSTVVPVIGLLAETAGTGLHQRDVENLKTLAQLDRSSRVMMMYSADQFLNFDSAVAPADRRRLLGLLDLYGLQRLLLAIDAGHTTPAELDSVLRDLSGIERLRDLIDQTFKPRADALKADRAMQNLEKISYQRDPAAESALLALRSKLQQLRRDPSMHILNELAALSQRARDTTALPEPFGSQLLRMTTGPTVRSKLGLPDESTLEAVRTAALDGAKKCRVFAMDSRTSPSQARLADILRRSYEIAYQAADDAALPAAHVR